MTKMAFILVYTLISAEPGFDINITNAHNPIMKQFLSRNFWFRVMIFSYLFTEGGGFQENKSLILWILAPHGFIFVEKKAEKHFWKNIMFTKESHKNNGIIFM